MKSDKKISRAGGGQGNVANNAPGLAVRSTLSSVQFFNALNKYVPSLVLTHWMERQIQKEVLQKQIRQYERLQNSASSRSTDGPALDSEGDDLGNNVFEQQKLDRPRHSAQPEAMKAQIQAM